MEHNWKPEDFYKDWNDPQWEMVCQVRVDVETEANDVARAIIEMLCKIDVFEAGDQFQIAKVGDFVCIVKARPFIEINPTIN